jgi:hypothetical protein
MRVHLVGQGPRIARKVDLPQPLGHERQELSRKLEFHLVQHPDAEPMTHFRNEGPASWTTILFLAFTTDTVWPAIAAAENPS